MLSTGNGGWVRYESSDLEAPVFIRFERKGRRFVPVDLFMASDGGLSAPMLRMVPLGRIETWANTPEQADLLEASSRWPQVDLRTAISYFGTTFGARAKDDWVRRMLQPQHGEPQPKPQPLSSGRPKKAAPVDARLVVPTTRDKGDDFYRQVAGVYQQLAQQTRAVAPAIADANGVANVSTVHRWIKEARARGFLPPGQVGKVG